MSWRSSLIKMDPRDDSFTSISETSLLWASHLNPFPKLIMEEVRSSMNEGYKEVGKPFRITSRTHLKAQSGGEHYMFEGRGRLPEDVEPSSMMVLHVTAEDRSMMFYAIAKYKIAEGVFDVRLSLSRETVRRPCFGKGCCWKAKYITSITSLQRMYVSCALIPSLTLGDSLARCLLAAPPTTIQTSAAYSVLNPLQQDVVSKLSSLNQGIALLQGPPGTGKTTTTVELIASYVSLGCRVLVSAPSNKAIQVLASRFHFKYPDTCMVLNGIERKTQDGLLPVTLQSWHKELKKEMREMDCNLLSEQIQLLDVQSIRSKMRNIVARCKNLVRLHSFYQLQLPSELTHLWRLAKDCFDSALQTPRSGIQSVQQSLTTTKDELTRKIDGYTEEYIERSLLSRSKVVFATLSVCGRHNMQQYLDKIDVLIVDEAGQSIEAETMIPLQHNPRVLILVGDTKQLSASISSTVAKRMGFERSLMERLETGTQTKKGIYMLQTQYRMDPQICAWPSQQYYNGRLQAASSIVPNAATNCLRQPVAFYDIAQGKEKEVGYSFSNEVEAQYVKECIVKLLEDTASPSLNSASANSVDASSVATDFQIKTIGVICFYAAQVSLIEEKLVEPLPINSARKSVRQQFPDVKIVVATADGFQGDECDVIILSSVRSNNKGEIGFLNDPRRLNVAITRAKRCLIILGDKKTLTKRRENDVFKLLESLTERRRCFGAADLDRFLGKLPPPPNQSTAKKTQKKQANSPSTALTTSVPTESAVPAPSPAVNTGTGTKKGRKQQSPTTTADELTTSLSAMNVASSGTLPSAFSDGPRPVETVPPATVAAVQPHAGAKRAHWWSRKKASA